MLKKILSLIALSSLLASLALADDVLALVTKVKLHNGVDEAYAISRYTSGESQYIINYAYGINAAKGLCGIDQKTCANPSANRMTEFLSMTNNSIDFFPVYSVKRNIGYGRYGKYVYFTYGVGVADTKGQIYKFNSSGMLNNNMIIKEMSAKNKWNKLLEAGG